MILPYALVIFGIIGSFGAHQPDIDINRLQRLPTEVDPFYASPYYAYEHSSADFDQVRRSNDYDDHSGGVSEPRRILYSAQTSYPKETVKIHQPRENPKLYYQSDAYVKEVNAKNVDLDVIATYPGREVIRVSEYENPSLLPRKTRNKENMIHSEYEKCFRCPRDRTLVSKAGTDRVMLQAPHLTTCSGRTASNKVKFIRMYGPKFGSFVTQGWHVIVGRITFNGKSLQLCKMEIHVIVQSCPVPKYLVAHCDQLNRSCNFTCKDSRLEIIGETSNICGNYMEWEYDLPVCRARRWCPSPIPPEHGRISCKGNHMAGGAGLTEGSKCRIRCAPDWRPTPRGVAVCRRGAWTHNIQCQPTRRYPKG